MHLLSGLPLALGLAGCSEGLDALTFKEEKVTNLIANLHGSKPVSPLLILRSDMQREMIFGLVASNMASHYIMVFLNAKNR